jgi:uncharacterized cupin superfamily protein
MSYALHSVIIKKPIALDEAKRLSKDFIKDKKKNFYRELKKSYHFRNLPKSKFVQFRTKKVNKKISLVYGELKPQFQHLEGSGFMDFLREGYNKLSNAVSSGVQAVSKYFSPRLDGYNNLSKKTIELYGNKKIERMQIYRTPIQKYIETALNVISVGKWKTLKAKNGYDTFFHLALVLTLEGGKNVIVEKNDVVNISTEYQTNKDTQIMDVPLKGKSITLNELLNKTRERLGDKKYFEYDALSDNCQKYIQALLTDANLINPDIDKFIYQDVGGILKEAPTLSRFARGITDLSATFNKIMGYGKERKKKKI